MLIKNKLKIIIPMLVFILAFSSFCFADDTTITETPKEGDLIVESNTKTEVLRVSANDTSGLHAIMLRLIGDYNPIVKDYVYQSSSGYQNHSIEISPDYSWLASCFVFVVVLFCVFRCIGGILKHE